MIGRFPAILLLGLAGTTAQAEVDDTGSFQVLSFRQGEMHQVDGQ